MHAATLLDTTAWLAEAHRAQHAQRPAPRVPITEPTPRPAALATSAALQPAGACC